MTETAAILARLDAIEAMLKQLIEHRAEVSPHNLSVDEEINLVLAQGLDPAAYLKARHAQRKREAQSQ